jgi:hypothetical protein
MSLPSNIVRHALALVGASLLALSLGAAQASAKPLGGPAKRFLASQ